MRRPPPVGFIKLTSYETRKHWYTFAECKLGDHRKCAVVRMGISESLRCDCRCHGGRR